jgi:formylglycine-generating enzyme
MGAEDGQWDELPAHPVTISRPFFMAATEVTNAQYEQFDPEHRQLRGKLGFSRADDEAVVFVSWHDAVAFCRWLSDRRASPIACRRRPNGSMPAGRVRRPRSTRATLPEAFHKNVGISWFPGRKSDKDVVPLHVGKTPANAWGLYDMHGNVEEWCLDWYGPYARRATEPAAAQTDPVGRAAGDFRVTRGGSHSTTLEFLRSANRAGTLPGARNWLTGFRVVLGEMPDSEPLPAERSAPQRPGCESADPRRPGRRARSGEALFRWPAAIRQATRAEECPVFNRHNHCPAIAECPNGDLLAIWYTCQTEPGRELGIVASRLPYGEDRVASGFGFLGRPRPQRPCLGAVGGPARDHLSLQRPGRRRDLGRPGRDHADVRRQRRHLVAGRTDPARFGLRHMPIESVIRTREGAILVPCDAVTGGSGGSAVLVSRDDGKTWDDPGEGRPAPDFSAGATGAWIAGIHAGFVQLADGRLLAFGRGTTSMARCR